MGMQAHRSMYTARYLDQYVEEDAAAVRDLIKLDWASMADDGMEYPGDDAIDQLRRDDTIQFMGVFGPDLMGVWMLHEGSVHTFIPMEHRGLALTIARVALDWAFFEVGYERLTTTVPTYNRRAAALAMGVGFKLEGFKRGDGTRNGTPYTSRLFYLTKEQHASNSDHHGSNRSRWSSRLR